MAEVCPSGWAVVRNPEPTKPVFIRASQADLYLRDVLVPCVADHFGEQEDLVFLSKSFAETFFVYFQPLILHRFLLFARFHGRAVDAVLRGHRGSRVSTHECACVLNQSFRLVLRSTGTTPHAELNRCT